MPDALLERSTDRAAIARSCGDAISRIAAGGAGILAVFCAIHVNAIVGGDHRSILPLVVDATAGVSACAVAWAGRRARHLDRIELLAFALAAIVAAVATITAHVYDDARELSYLAFTPLALAATCVRRWRWLGVTAMIYADALIAAWQVSDDPGLRAVMPTLLSMSASVVIAIAIHASRRSSFTSILAAQRRERELAGQLRQVQKLDAIGTLAGGIAHDINNVLAAILGVAELAREDVPAELPVHAELGEIMSAAERGAQLTRNLLGFARRGKHRHERVPLGAVIDPVVALLARTAPRGIRFERCVEEDPCAAGDPAQLSQVVMNLCINAIDAIRDSGTITISAAELGIADGERATLAAGRYVCLTVTDTGCGMSAETLEHAFEPFYSTKAATSRSGSGLGLAMVYGTVRDHLGDVSLASTPGAGTTATIYLPAALDGDLLTTSTVTRPRRRSQPQVPAALVARPILVVDDEALVREVCVRALRVHDVAARQAGDGRRGLELFAAEPQRFSMVLLDLAMPVMTGAECFRAIRAIDPAIPVVLMSGFPKDQSVDELLAMGRATFLTKPFARCALLEAICQAGMA